MNVNLLKESSFLKKEDCGKNGIIVTIAGLEQKNVAMADKPEELKYCLNFEEDLKPMVLNAVNSQLIASITGEDDTDNWPGHKIILYHDPSIMYAGKLVGGIRVRAAKKQTATAPKTKLPPVDPGHGPEPDEETPF